jgi:hypothetical protein
MSIRSRAMVPSADTEFQVLANYGHAEVIETAIVSFSFADCQGIGTFRQSQGCPWKVIAQTRWLVFRPALKVEDWYIRSGETPDLCL